MLWVGEFDQLYSPVRVMIVYLCVISAYYDIMGIHSSRLGLLNMILTYVLPTFTLLVGDNGGSPILRGGGGGGGAIFITELHYFATVVILIISLLDIFSFI